MPSDKLADRSTLLPLFSTGWEQDKARDSITDLFVQEFYRGVRLHGPRSPLG